MSRQVKISTEDIQRAKQLRDKAITLAEYRKALSVLLPGELGLDADRTAELLGTSRRTVFRNRGRIRNQGDTPKNLWGGRRHCVMTIEEEKEFLAQWIDKATIGGVLTVPPIHAALVERLGRDIPMSTTYRLLARHGWRKVQPDTKHPKSDPALQDEFKKNSPKQWQPACVKNEDNLPLRLMFQDEARFGRISDPRSCWAPAPYRPVVNLALVREFRYEYAAVSPWDGCLDFMTAEKMNTENMSRFLDQVSTSHKDEFILMVLDGASYHRSKELNIPKNVSFIRLPPYSPDLNPAEQIWNILRRDYFANRVFDSLTCS